MGASKPSSRKNRNNRTRRRLLIAGLAVFLLVDAGLVAFALTAPKPAASAGTVAAVPTATLSPVETPEATPAPEVEPVEAMATATVVPTRILGALDESTAWRALTGTCPSTSANLELTTDSGATWESFNASTETGASSVLAINVADDSEVSLVTLDAADCGPQLVTTFVAGNAWKSYPDRVAAEWYVNPATSNTAHTPAGDVAAPCVSVAAIAVADSSTAAVLCIDASVFTTQDSGATWSAPSNVPGAAAIAGTNEGFQVAVANPAGCVGISLVSVSRDGALDDTSRPCVDAIVGPGETGLSVGEDGTLWLWAGDRFARSADGGATWG
ncbi:hypothetical protein [Cryobacterium sp. TMB1-7]|uniref:WD40/YVTN/BNR-like repeat-containing protein n=1 Tax=Cryobacterium sp. TMB1-7 TaxID=2555866 RepID=UPI00106C0978|nr:hypothetical protein [Cryobacterium sp. TMB1-7]TFC61645.1 hypothetical protein E3O60_03595 [Cryobacterium sp. TMB1-7]